MLGEAIKPTSHIVISLVPVFVMVCTAVIVIPLSSISTEVVALDVAVVIIEPDNFVSSIVGGVVPVPSNTPAEDEV